MSMPVKSKHRFKVGDRVRFRLGAHLVTGTVVEDRGSIGVRGEQVVRVEVPLDRTYTRDFELPTGLLSRAPRRRAAA
jgi:hypothetical protein